MPLLEVNSVGKTFGHLNALDDVNVSVENNTFHGLIGPNGSGKSTLLKTIAGDLIASQGAIYFDRLNITTMSPFARARLGISLKFQITAVLPELSPYDNLLLSAQADQSVWRLLRSSTKRELHDEIMHNLERFSLADHADDLAAELSHGQQQWLEIAMSLIRKPKLLLLDEPTGGMSPAERQATGELLLPLKQQCSLVIVEHDIDFIKDICDYLTVLDQGRVLEHGTVAEIEASSKVQSVYVTRV